MIVRNGRVNNLEWFIEEYLGKIMCRKRSEVDVEILE